MFKNHGKKVSTCAKASNGKAGFDVTDECHSCIVSQVAQKIPVGEQESCGQSVEPAICQNGAVELTTAPNGLAILCDDLTDSTCEQDLASLCPVGWDLCTHAQFTNRNDGWDFLINSSMTALGEIQCRLFLGDIAGAGHLTVPYPSFAGEQQLLSFDTEFNCQFGSSRDTCTSNFGCNELYATALCCAPTPTCGNSIVDTPEELCDDGNTDETDTCLNTCTWRIPAANGLRFEGCGF